MIYKIIGLIVVVICGVTSFFAKKVLSAVYKTEPDEKSIVILKFSMLLFVIIGALIVILPDYLS